MNKNFKDILEISNIKLSESLDSGSKYKCILIRAGMTKTANLTLNVNNTSVNAFKNYTAESIKQAIESGLFENAPALIRSVDSHLKVENTGINSYAGNYTNVVWNEELQCAEAIYNPSAKIKIKLAEIWKDVGLSIAADISGYLSQSNSGQYVINVTKFNDLQSIDLVSAGNAGGKITALVAESLRNINSHNNLNLKTGESQMNPEMKQKIYDLLNASHFVGEGKTIKMVSDEDMINGLLQHAHTLMNTVDTSLAESEITAKKNEIASLLAYAINEGNKKMSALVAEAKTLITKVPVAEEKPVDKTDLQKMEELLNDAKKLNSQNYLNSKVAESKLPTPLKDKIHKLYDGNFLSNEQIDSIMVAEQEAFSKLDPTFVNNGGHDIKPGQDEVDKFALTMEYLMIDPNTFRTKMAESERAKFKDVAGNHSFLELYRHFTGDNKVSGKLFKGSIGESIISTTFAEIMGISMHRSMLREYSTSVFNQDWKKIVQIVPRSDFKDNTVTNMGGYDDFPVVLEAGEYQPATTPGEDAVSYKLLKRGYVETITMEAIRNDDLGAIRKIPVKWGRVSARVIYKYVFNQILNNTAMAYDSKALLHADHSNLLASAALDKNSYFEVIKLLNQQVEKNSAEQLALVPRFLLVCLADLPMAYELTTVAAGMQNAIAAFSQTYKVEPIVVAGQTARSWRIVADPSCASLMEMGFLDGNEEPEMFTQDLPTQGYAFTNDGIKLKVRHIYAGKLTDHRAIAGTIIT